jgi:DNA-binding MarR family transcriptional regulator
MAQQEDRVKSFYGPPLLGALLRIPLEEIQRRMIAGLHEAGYTDIVPAHLAVLRYPGPRGQRPVEFAAETGMSKQAMNYLLNELERLGYVERRDDPDDPRFKRVYLTGKGDEIRKVIRATVKRVEREWARELGADDLDRLKALLRRLQPIAQNGGQPG